MRSELVFVANGNVDNRFKLCHLVRVASRRFHKAGDPIQSTINKVLSLVTEQTNGAVVDNKGLWESSFHSSAQAPKAVGAPGATSATKLLAQVTAVAGD
ncbi:MAG TPA: hypothetical protein VMZ25_08125 [Terriglobales bacterium]|nr:hypothetical protein [Terriglobales bacterium]